MEAVTDGMNCRYLVVGGLDGHISSELSLWMKLSGERIQVGEV